MTNGICKLCGNNTDLKESHIVPRFVYQWMRKTGGSYFRSTGEPMIRKQDGAKNYLLCGDCEQRFSSREAYFKCNIFDAYLNDGVKCINYDQRLFYFLISVAWRVLIKDLAEPNVGTHRFILQLREAEAEWRNYLLSECIPSKYNETHLFLTDLFTGNTLPVRRMNLYFARAVDGTIVSSETKCAIYWKFSRFLSFSSITPFDQSLWVGTRINPSGGTLTIPQQMKDGIMGEFMADRARIAAEAAKDILTDKQKEFHINRIKQNPSEFLASDLGKTLKADSTHPVDPHVLYPKVGRNDLCPCGSGIKYKKCHGINQ
jgi:uncharacterized protein YchJ